MTVTIPLQTGYGEEKGGITSIISNQHSTKAVKIVYFDVVPWYIPVNLHSLRVEKNDEKFKPGNYVFLHTYDLFLNRDVAAFSSKLATTLLFYC